MSKKYHYMVLCRECGNPLALTKRKVEPGTFMEVKNVIATKFSYYKNFKTGQIIKCKCKSIRIIDVRIKDELAHLLKYTMVMDYKLYKPKLSEIT